MLIDNGAEVNVKRDDGFTPLHTAVIINAAEVAKLLIANGADVNAKDKDGYTPLSLHALYVAEANAAEIRKLLIANGATD